VRSRYGEENAPPNEIHRKLNERFISAHPPRRGINSLSAYSFQLLKMSKYTAFRCPEDLLELAKVKAKKDRRSLSNYIITLIEKDVCGTADGSAPLKPEGKSGKSKK
jgi:hypothetical protein